MRCITPRPYAARQVMGAIASGFSIQICTEKRKKNKSAKRLRFKREGVPLRGSSTAAAARDGCGQPLPAVMSDPAAVVAGSSRRPRFGTSHIAVLFPPVHHAPGRCVHAAPAVRCSSPAGSERRSRCRGWSATHRSDPVSYTHLTLPTTVFV